jgi:hypothetical protein
MAKDDEEARRRRAEQLRRRTSELAKGKFPEGPPASPHEFIEREMRDPAEEEREEEEDEDDEPPA